MQQDGLGAHSYFNCCLDPKLLKPPKTLAVREVNQRREHSKSIEALCAAPPEALAHSPSQCH